MGIEFNIAIIVKRARQPQRTSPKRTEESTQRRQEKERERQAGMQAKENTVQRVVASSVSMYFALYLCQHHEHTHILVLVGCFSWFDVSISQEGARTQ